MRFVFYTTDHQTRVTYSMITGQVLGPSIFRLEDPAINDRDTYKEMKERKREKENLTIPDVSSRGLDL